MRRRAPRLLKLKAPASVLLHRLREEESMSDVLTCGKSQSLLFYLFFPVVVVESQLLTAAPSR